MLGDYIWQVTLCSSAMCFYEELCTLSLIQLQRVAACNAVAMYVVCSSAEYAAGRASLIHQFASQFNTYMIACYVTSAAVSVTPVQYRFSLCRCSSVLDTALLKWVSRAANLRLPLHVQK